LDAKGGHGRPGAGGYPARGRSGRTGSVEGPYVRTGAWTSEREARLQAATRRDCR
jgi:hypothetical protein